jgi:glycogen synthase
MRSSKLTEEVFPKRKTNSTGKDFQSFSAEEQKRENYNRYMKEYYHRKMQDKEFQLKQKEYGQKKREKMKKNFIDPLLNIECYC